MKFGNINESNNSTTFKLASNKIENDARIDPKKKSMISSTQSYVSINDMDQNLGERCTISN